MGEFCNMPDPYNKIIRKTIDRFIPFKVDWEITYRCNLRCVHCYQTGPKGEQELSSKEFFSILNQLADSGCLYITFTGGEIFLRKDFFTIADYARKREFAIRLFTNGTLIDEQTADKIKELNPLTVEISLYGLEPSVHENITRVSGSYERTINALELLKRRRINTVVKCTVMKENVAEFNKLKEFAENLGAGFRFALTVIPKIDGSKEILKFRLNQGQLRKLAGRFTQGLTKGGVHSYQPLCAAGFNSLYISPYGEVFPCVVLREYCGNLKELSLQKIWQAPFFKRLRQIEFKDLEQCSSCRLAFYCDRCAGLARLETGDLLGPSPNDCKLAQVRQWAMERINQRGIKDGEKEREKILQEA